MAKRGRKKQTDSIESLLTGIVVFPAILIWLNTTSVTYAIIFLVISYIGVFVLVRILKQRKEQRLMESGIYDIDKMKGVQFEHYLSALYRSLGYTAQVTKTSGDFGADLILKKDNRKIVVQAKRYSKNVGIRAVQEIRAAKEHYQADEAWVVTNQEYTKSAIELSKTSKVKLVGREQLINIIMSTKGDAISKGNL